jgi:Histone methylation protein DOT1
MSTASEPTLTARASSRMSAPSAATMPAQSATPAFTSDDDMALLLLSVHFNEMSGDIDWDSVRKSMVPSHWSKEELQERLQYLKLADTSLMWQIPVEYFLGSSLYPARTNRPTDEIYEAIEKIFCHLSKADVRQPSGERHLNAGEIAPLGVTAILQVADLGYTDTFLDIGSGIGSVVAQVILMTPVCQAIGLEIRSALAKKSRDAIQAAKEDYERLHLVRIITGDIKALTKDMDDQLEPTTVVYSNNLCFQPADNLYVDDFICRTPNIRLVILSDPFCPRCTGQCTKTFCKLWKEFKTVSVKACWTDTPINVTFYKRVAKDPLLRMVQDL